MKSRTTTFYRGCPADTEFYRCIAHKKNGRLCQKPATRLDPQRGGYVCDAHHAELITDLKAEAAGVNLNL